MRFWTPPPRDYSNEKTNGSCLLTITHTGIEIWAPFQYKDSHFKYKTVSWPSYLYDGNPHTFKLKWVPVSTWRCSGLCNNNVCIKGYCIQHCYKYFLFVKVNTQNANHVQATASVSTDAVLFLKQLKWFEMDETYMVLWTHQDTSFSRASSGVSIVGILKKLTML